MNKDARLKVLLLLFKLMFQFLHAHIVQEHRWLGWRGVDNSEKN